MRSIHCALVVLVALPTIAIAAEVQTISPPPGDVEVFEGIVLPDQHGLTVQEIGSAVPCIPDEEIAMIEERVARNRERLYAEGVLDRPDPLAAASVPELQWPLRQAPGWNYYETGTAVITAFVDHDPLYPDQLLDWNCGTRSYDTDTGNHRGTDFYIWPYPWYKMDNDLIEIVAAAPGTIIYRTDGNYDRNCAPAGTSNTVQVQHADGSSVVYGHMKSGSVTPKLVGDTVEAGEYLGTVGSSGSSTGPHLHFQVYDSEGGVVDPYYGPCNSMNPASLWAEQRPYLDSNILRVRSHSATPVSQPCPEQAIRNEKRDTFLPGEPIQFRVTYQDWIVGTPSYYRIVMPDGEVQSSWSYTPTSTWGGVEYYANRTIPADAQTGVWWFEATLGDQTVRWAYGVNIVVAAPVALGPFDPHLRHWPNPSSSSTTIRFDLPQEQPAELAIFDARGRLVRTLRSGAPAFGPCQSVWDGRDDEGRVVGAGVYFYRLKGEGFSRTQKLTLLR